MTDEQVNGFHSDFKYVADYFVQMQRTGTYIGSPEDMCHVREVLYLMTALTGDGRFASVAGTKIAEDGKGEVKNMCEVLDMIEKRGYDQGYESSARKPAIKMYQKGIDLEDIAEIIGTGIETIRDWLSEAGECMQ